jgi:peptidylamidoglycolate lyase
VLAQASPALHIFDPSGKLVDAWGEKLGGAHGLTLVVENGVEYLWITDQMSGEVSKRDLSGTVCQSIAVPPVEDGIYAPTSVAISPSERDVLVADGYGSNSIRCYSKDGDLIGKLTGEEGPGAFARPHGIAFHPDGTLYIADRRNKRILGYSNKGKYLFHRDNIAHSPCGFAFHGAHLYVPELFGSLKVLDRSLDVVASYGSNFAVRPKEGWPAKPGWGWPELNGWPDDLAPDITNSNLFVAPHDVAVAPDGTMYVVEWVKGGRILRLRDSRM